MRNLSWLSNACNVFSVVLGFNDGCFKSVVVILMLMHAKLIFPTAVIFCVLQVYILRPSIVKVIGTGQRNVGRVLGKTKWMEHQPINNNQW